ncbi:ABC transporter permease subunit [Halorussus sp. AFM4]|uniref:ABC transporter permease subunit n=1 Tax=Halorussus sp. AFM4 TaxID=3421651 RepID=UPI003EBF5167
MSWRVVAERDALDPHRSRSGWVYLAVYALLFGLLGYLSAGSVPLGASLATVAAYFVPLTALTAGYQAVVGSRQNGGLRVVLSFPHTRREVVVGTAVGRAVVIATLVTISFAVAALIRLVTDGVPDLGVLAVAWALSVALGAAVASFSVALSASVRTTNRAAVLAFGSFLLFAGLWGQIPTAVRFVLNGFSFPSGPTPEWVAAFAQLNPTTAFQTALRGLAPGSSLPGGPFYQTAWFALLVLAAWLCVPLALGSLRFERSDL